MLTFFCIAHWEYLSVKLEIKTAIDLWKKSFTLAKKSTRLFFSGKIFISSFTEKPQSARKWNAYIDLINFFSSTNSFAKEFGVFFQKKDQNYCNCRERSENDLYLFIIDVYD